MNRRGFLSNLFKGAITASVAPQIVTHGLKLKNGLYQQSYELIYNVSVNPEWIAFPYRTWFIWDKPTFDTINVGPPPQKSNEVSTPASDDSLNLAYAYLPLKP